jgi:hypothetical protein
MVLFEQKGCTYSKRLLKLHIWMDVIAKSVNLSQPPPLAYMEWLILLAFKI